MASSSSSSRTRGYDVFPSFSGEDVRRSFLSHLLKELDRKLIVTFIDHGIERSRPIGPELLSAIRESRISIVVFSKKYASSTWCLNELVEIYKCYEELDQMVIPVFYDVDPSHVRKQTGYFGEVFEETCKGKTEDEKQRWMRALREVANMAGEDSQNWSDEASMIEQISNNVSNKLFTPSADFSDFIGNDAHIKAMNSILCLESKEVRMVGIVGPSGIGKSTIAGALFNQLSSQFHHRAFISYKRTTQDDYSTKLNWAKEFLSEILGQNNIKIESLGVVEQRLKHKKILVVVDDVDDIELLETLVGQTGWFGFGSRIIVVTQNRQILKSHEIDLVYEVQFPSVEVALQMFCRYAFRRNSPPDGFMELAVEVVNLSGYLPLGLKVLGSSLRKKDKENWVQMMPMLQSGLNGKIEKTLRICYDGLDDKDDQDTFLYIACLFNGEKVNYIKNLLEDSVFTSVNTRLGVLVDRSLICISSPHETVQMHTLLQKLGREIVRRESIYNPGKRRFLLDAKDICDVFKDNTGTDKVLAISCNTSEIKEPFSMDKKSFKRMHNIQFIKLYKGWWMQNTGEVKLNLPRGLTYLPRKLRLLHWDEYPAKYIPSNFSAEHLVELTMEKSKLEKLWEGTQQLRSLKKMNIARSKDLKEIPDLSNATNLETLSLSGCTSLVALPSSIRSLKKLTELWMFKCSKLEVLPIDVNLESLERLDLSGCLRLTSFPRISKSIYELYLGGTAIREEECFWIENICGLTSLCWTSFPLRCMPSNFRPENLRTIELRGKNLEKLWEGVQSLGELYSMNLSGCENLKEIPDLTKANNLERLDLSDCKSLVVLPSSIQNLYKLKKLYMKGCTRLEFLPTNVNLVSLRTLDLSGCSQLASFPHISTSIRDLSLDKTAIEEVPFWIENICWLRVLNMSGCKRLKNISPSIFNLRSLEEADFSNCCGPMSFSDASVVGTVGLEDNQWLSTPFDDVKYFQLHNCFNLDGDAHEVILKSHISMVTILPGGEVPTYFTHRAYGSSLIITLPHSSLSQEFMRFKACAVIQDQLSNLTDSLCR